MTDNFSEEKPGNANNVNPDKLASKALVLAQYLDEGDLDKAYLYQQQYRSDLVSLLPKDTHGEQRSKLTKMNEAVMGWEGFRFERDELNSMSIKDPQAFAAITSEASYQSMIFLSNAAYNLLEQKKTLEKNDPLTNTDHLGKAARKYLIEAIEKAAVIDEIDDAAGCLGILDKNFNTTDPNDNFAHQFALGFRKGDHGKRAVNLAAASVLTGGVKGDDLTLNEKTTLLKIKNERLQSKIMSVMTPKHIKSEERGQAVNVMIETIRPYNTAFSSTRQTAINLLLSPEEHGNVSGYDIFNKDHDPEVATKFFETVQEVMVSEDFTAASAISATLFHDAEATDKVTANARALRQKPEEAPEKILKEIIGEGVSSIGADKTRLSIACHHMNRFKQNKDFTDAVIVADMTAAALMSNQLEVNQRKDAVNNLVILARDASGRKAAFNAGMTLLQSKEEEIKDIGLGITAYTRPTPFCKTKTFLGLGYRKNDPAG